MENEVTEQLRVFLTSANVREQILETIEISHPDVVQKIYITGNFTPGGSFLATLEDDTVVSFMYRPLTIQRNSQSGNLNQTFSITIQDMNLEVSPWADQIPLESLVPPIMKIRTYTYNRETRVVSSLVEGPYTVLIKQYNQNELGSTIEGQPSQTALTGSGERMTIDRFPMLRGFVR